MNDKENAWNDMEIKTDFSITSIHNRDRVAPGESDSSNSATSHDEEHAEPSSEDLEDRLKRLEAALASVQDVNAIEDRVIQRVQQELETKKPATNENIQEEKKSTRSGFAGWFGSAKKTASAAKKTVAAASAAPSVIKEAWFLVEVWKEAKAIFHMFLDRQYYIPMWIRLVTLGIVLVIVFSQFVFGAYYIPVVGNMLDNLIALVLAFVLYKALSREARHYMIWKEEKQA